MKKRIVSLLLCLVMCLSVIPMNAFATESDPDLGVCQQQCINQYFQPILDDPDASDALKAIAQEAIEKIMQAESIEDFNQVSGEYCAMRDKQLECDKYFQPILDDPNASDALKAIAQEAIEQIWLTEGYEELVQVSEKYDGLIGEQRALDNFIQENLGEYLAFDETKDLAQECVDKILAAENWEQIYAIWDEYEPALRLPKDIEESIANLTEEFLNSDECSDEMKALVQDIINELRTVTTVEEYEAIGDKFESAMNLQRDKDEFIAILTEDFLDSGEFSDEMKALARDAINKIKAATTAEELEELMEEIESALDLQYEKDKAIAILTEGYLNSDEYSDEMKALVRDTINEIKAVTTMEELNALEEKFEDMMDLQEAKEEAIADASEVLTSDKESDEMKALAQKFIDEVKAATTMEELEEIWDKYDPLIDLQRDKDEARNEVKTLLPEDASNAVKKIVSDACAAIQANDDPDQYDDIIEAARQAVDAQLQKEAELAPAKADAIAEINAAKTSANEGVVKAAIAAINNAQSEEEIGTLKTQALVDMAKVDALTAPTLSISKADGKINLSWTAVSGANKYWIYRSTDGKNFSYYDSTTKTSYTNSSVTSGTKYYYKVKAVVTINGTNYAGVYSAAKSTIPMTTPVLKVSLSSGTAKLSWAAVTGATKYWIYRSTDGKNFSYYDSTTKTSYTNSSVTAGNTYYYKVKAVRTEGSTDWTSDYSVAGSVKVALKAPELSISKTAGKIKLSWTAVSGATKYYIYRSTDGTNFKYYGSTTNTSYTNSSVTSGTKYYYKVKAVNSADITSAYSAVKSTIPMATPTLSATLSSGKIKLSWGAVTGATKYWIYRSTDGKNFSYYDSTTKTTYTNSSVTAGKTYYYKVKAVKTVSSTDWTSDYSNAVSKKI